MSIVFLSIISSFINPVEYLDTFTPIAVIVAIALTIVLAFGLIKAIQLWKKPPKVAPIVEGEKIVPSENAKPNIEIFVQYRGEYWKARSPTGIVEGKAYRIAGKDGIVLILEPIETV